MSKNTTAFSKRIVVLGSRGFLGKALCERFDLERVLFFPVSSVELDLTQADAGEKLSNILQPNDVVVMNSALTPDKGRDVSTLMKNLRMAEAVAIATQKVPISHLVYISSDALYSFRSGLISEETPIEAVDLYALMHLSREKILSTVCAEKGILFAALRCTAIYGPGDTHNGYGPNRFIRTAQKEKVISLFGEGEETRDHVYIDDVVQAIWGVIERGVSGLLNVASGSSVSFFEVAQAVNDTMGGEIQIKTSERKNEVTYRRFDVSRLAAKLGSWSPISLNTGLRRGILPRAKGE
jgi:nucleoside-diphosphate-sugar epimerase